VTSYPSGSHTERVIDALFPGNPLLCALADASEMVGVPDLTAALALWRYCEASAYRLFRSRATDSKVQKVLGALYQAPGGLSRTEINARAFNPNESAAAIHQALKRLRAAGFVHSIRRNRPAAVPRSAGLAPRTGTN
jgi:hypothetical protein